MLFWFIPTTYFLCFIIISIVFPLIIFLLKIKYTIVNVVMLAFCFSAEFIFGKFIYIERGIPSGEEIVLIDSLLKYKNIINIIELFILLILFINFIYAIIFSIRWLKNNNT
jgi:hypothetical protein